MPPLERALYRAQMLSIANAETKLIEQLKQVKERKLTIAAASALYADLNQYLSNSSLWSAYDAGRGQLLSETDMFMAMVGLTQATYKMDFWFTNQLFHEYLKTLHDTLLIGYEQTFGHEQNRTITITNKKESPKSNRKVFLMTIPNEKNEKIEYEFHLKKILEDEYSCTFHLRGSQDQKHVFINVRLHPLASSTSGT